MQQVPYKLISSTDLKFADIASAATVNLDAAVGNYGQITGTTSITAITLSEGKSVWVRFTGALTLTHGASLVLPGAVNRVTAVGDWSLFVKVGAAVYLVEYLRAAGTLDLPGGQIKFPATPVPSADLNTLDDYVEVAGAVAACTGALTVNSSWDLVKVGKVVTLYLPPTTGTTSAASSFAFGTSLPAAYRPATNVAAMCRTLDNLIGFSGVVTVSSSGVVQVNKSVDFSVNFTAATTGGLGAGTAVSWLMP